MKKFLLGFLTAVILGITTTVFAATYNAVTATFPVFVNGVKFETDKPILAIEGSTYLPLKAVGEALGINVVWNTDASCVDISSNELKSGNFTLKQGQYVVGEDIASGKYNCVAVKGSGNFTGKVASLGFMGLNTILDANLEFFDTKEYNNLRLQNGDVIQIASLEIEFIPCN